MHNSQQKLLRWLPIPRSYKSHKPEEKNSTNLRFGRPIQTLIFFTIFYLYLWLYVDLRLLYHGAGIITNFPVFYKGWTFFQNFLSYPGGPLEYLSAFLSQFLYYSWAGAMVVTLQSWLLSICVAYLLEIVNFPRICWIRFIIPILLLITYTMYIYFFTTTLALLTALLFACLYLKIASQRTTVVRHAGTFLFLSIILYYLAGGAFLIFAITCAIYELFFRFRWKTSLFFLLPATVIPYLAGLLIFRVSIIDAYCNLLPFSWKILYYETRRRGVIIVYLIFLLPPLVLLLCGLWQTLTKGLRFIKSRIDKEFVQEQKNKSPDLITKTFVWYLHSPKLRWIIESSLLLIIAGGTVYLNHNENLRTQFQVDYFAYHRMWPELLKAARKNPTDPLIIHSVNRALYHTGRLGYEMFSWPQHPDYLFLINPVYRWHYWRNFDVYLDIGLINIAENDLTECLEGLGDRPMILQKLALINLVKANTDTARIYLNTLNKTIFHADWAKHYLELLQTDPNLSSDEYIQQLRSLTLNKDYYTLALPTYTMLYLLLEENSQNRMAFEYLMAWYMLTRHLDNFVKNIERLKDFGYPQIPTHYEEASLVYVAGTGKPFHISGYRVSDTLRQRIEDFGRILSNYSQDKRAAYSELASKYRDTYFFYFLYAPSETKE